MIEVMYDYWGKPTDLDGVAVFKEKHFKDKPVKYYIKRSAYGHFFNEARITHEKAIKQNSQKPYEFCEVNTEIFEEYVRFIKTRNQGRANVAERLYNEGSSQRS